MLPVYFIIMKETFTIQTSNSKIEITYQVFGLPIGTAPVVLVFHALTGNSQATGTNGWWQQVIGNQQAIDTNQVSVIAIEIPSATSFHFDLKEYKPFITIKDLVPWYDGLLSSLAINSIDMVIGGSLGGALALEFVAESKLPVKNVIAIACLPENSHWSYGLLQVQEEILLHNTLGLELARKQAMLFYRSPEGLEEKFQNQSKKDGISSWLEYHANSLKNRFSKEDYLFRNHLLMQVQVKWNLFLQHKLKRHQTKIVFIGISSDQLYPNTQIQQVAKLWKNDYPEVYFEELISAHGHDAFLIDQKQVSELIQKHDSKSKIHENESYL
jgi:homoserine O-acetyltransferase